MKTINKVQKTGNRNFNPLMSIVFAAVVGLAIISSAEVSTHRNNSNETVTSKAKMEETLQIEPSLTDESNFISLNDISNGKIEKTLGYHPVEFVNAEMAIENENMENGTYESAEAELELQIEELTNESEYSTSKFVEAEMLLENENRINNEDFLETAEVNTADGSDKEVARYAQKVINAEEIKPAFEDETHSTYENFFQTAEALTANGAEQEVARYAQKLINAVEPALEIETWMTNENFFKAAEALTANGAEKEVARYAQQQIICSRN